MISFHSTVALGVFIACQCVSGSCQASLSASPCDLVNSPEKYSEKVVTITAGVSIGFENFTLESPGCDEKGRPIWLAYGGDEPTPTMSMVNDQSRPSGSVLKVNGKPVLLRKDDELELFKRRLAAVRIAGFGDRDCADECRLYKVTATFTGVFFAAPPHQIGVYGHMGCCHLLAIEQVANVDARRTAVPEGGRFSCSTENWSVGVDEAQAIAAPREQCRGFEGCHMAARDEIVAAARHWEDLSHEVDQGTLEFFAGLSWSTSDRLTAYSVETNYQDPKHKDSPVIGMTVSRAVCNAVSPPLPMSTSIGCRSLWSEFSTTKDEAKSIQDRVKQGDDLWRLGPAEKASRRALEDAAQRWGVRLAPGIEVTGCGKPAAFEGDEFSWCGWSDPEGMQSLSVQVTRLGSLRHGRNWEEVPWVLSRGHGLACETE